LYAARSKESGRHVEGLRKGMQQDVEVGTELRKTKLLPPVLGEKGALPLLKGLSKMHRRGPNDLIEACWGDQARERRSGRKGEVYGEAICVSTCKECNLTRKTVGGPSSVPGGVGGGRERTLSECRERHQAAARSILAVGKIGLTKGITAGGDPLRSGSEPGTRERRRSK